MNGMKRLVILPWISHLTFTSIYKSVEANNLLSSLNLLRILPLISLLISQKPFFLRTKAWPIPLIIEEKLMF
jgi:hypothetical protein